MQVRKPGLDGVEVVETVLSSVDGENGVLIVRGHTLEELRDFSFEEMTRLLWDETVAFGDARVEAYESLQPILSTLGRRSPSEAMRLGLAALPNSSQPREVAAAFPVLLAAARHGAEMDRPNSEIGHVEDLLRMFQRATPSPEACRALTTYLVTVAEHGMNASTFCGRVVASTQASCVETATAAFCALCGPLHGGAPGPVLDLLDELEESQDPRRSLEQKVRRGERLMGFGHRVYKTRDPRAEILRAAVSLLKPTHSLHHAETVEKAATEVLSLLKPGRSLYTNVEFYTAVLLHELEFPREYFTPLFATGRILGWMAHYKEQQNEGRLMRPRARYVGPTEAQREISSRSTPSA